MGRIGMYARYISIPKKKKPIQQLCKKIKG